VETIKAGYPYLKESIGLPPWLLPASSLGSTVDALGDEGILKLGRPLNLGTGFKVKSESASGPLAMSPEGWHNATTKWPSREIARPIIETLMEVTSRITSQMDHIRLIFDPQIATRNLAVLAFAPFIAAGKLLLKEAAGILDADIGDAPELLRKYAQAVIDGDVSTVENVNDCILKYKAWVKWADMLQRQALGFKHQPRLIAVTPPLSPELSGVLATMLKEGNAR